MNEKVNVKHTSGYNVIKTMIATNEYKLEEMLNKKLPEYYIRNFITDSEYEELVKLAKDNAVPEYPEVEKQIIELQNEVNELKQIVESLKEQIEQNTGKVIEPKPNKKYKKYKQPLNSEDAYYNGMGCIENGIKYDCIAPEGYAVTFPPSLLPSMWEEVSEQETK